MASGGSKSAAYLLLFVNLVLYLIVIIVASWAVNHGIDRSHESASVLTLPAHIFPIYFPFGNMATGPFIIFSLIAGVIGMLTSLTVINNVTQWNPPNLHSAASSSLLSCALSLLAMGFAWKEINLGWTDANLRTLETIMIIVSVTQLFCTVAIHSVVEDVLPGSTIRSRV